MIRVLLLGTPAVFQDDQPVRIPRRTQRALFYYLACHAEPVSRAELALVFWPEASEPDARRHLREAISKLRAALPDGNIWLQTPDYIGLDHTRVYVDMIHYRQLLARVWRSVLNVPTHLPLPEAVYQEIQQALSMWRGLHFLSGANLPSSLELERWQLNQAQDMEYSLQRLQERLAYHYAAGGYLDQAIYWLRQALLSDELNETLHRQVLEWRRRQGRRGELLDYIKQLRELYQREVGALPDPLESLCARYERASPSRAQTPSPWPEPAGLEIPFVGRADLLHTLRLAYRAGGWMALSGEAGAGKTRLLRQFAQSLDPAPRLFYARARASAISLPFQPIIDVLRQSVARDDWLQLGPIWGLPLALLLPELAELWPDLPPPAAAEIDSARGQLLEALRQLVVLLCKDRPVLFIMDDSHWCDEATLDALAYLEEHGLFARRGLLALAHRPEARNLALDVFLTRPRRPARSRLTLAELTASEIAELTRYTLGQTPPDELVERLSNESGGNPLFLLEILRAWLDGSAQPDLSLPVETLPSAPSLRALLRERIQGISEEKRAVLTTAAVIGHEFTPAVLEAATALPTERLVGLLEDLERDHLFAPIAADEQPESYAFIHDSLRELLLLDLSPARRRMLHMRAADALEATTATQTPQQAVALAEHRQAAGQDEQAYRLWLRAAEYARHLYASTEAYQAYRRAERLVERIAPRLSDADLAALFSEWGELAYDLNDADTQQAAYTALLAHGEERGSPWLVGSALSGLASGQCLRGEYGEALQTLAQAVPYLEQSGDLYERILARVRRGRFLIRNKRYEEALASFREAAALEPAELDARVRRVIVRAHSYISMTCSLSGWPLLALQAGEDALRQSRLLRFPVSQARARTSLAITCFLLARYNDSLEHCRIGLEMGEAAIGTLRAGLLRVVSARCHLGLGQLDAAWVLVQQALLIPQRRSWALVIGEANCLLGDLFRLMYCPGEGLQYYQAGLRAVEPDSFTGLELRYRLSSALAQSGETAAAAEQMRASLLLARQSGLGVCEVFAETHLADIEIRAGDFDSAEERLSVARQAGQERGFTIIPPQCDLLSARLLHARGCSAQALPLAEQVIGAGRALGNPLLELSALRELAIAQLAVGLPAEDTLSSATALLDRLETQATHPAVRPAFLVYRDAFNLERLSF